ncbi:hypothetical protein ES705_27016 [subsurface metagenome]
MPDQSEELKENGNKELKIDESYSMESFEDKEELTTLFAVRTTINQEGCKNNFDKSALIIKINS